MAYLFDDASSEGFSYGGSVPNAYPLTVSAWIRPDDVATQMGVMGLGDKDVSTHNVLLYHRVDNAYFFHNTYGGAGILQAPFGSPPTQNVWSHMWGSVEKSGADHITKVSINNATAATNTSSNPADFTNNDEWWIGGRFSSSPDNPYSGYLAEIAAWSALLSADEKAALALGYSPLLIRPASLIFYAPLHNSTIDLLNPGRTVTTGGSPVASPGVHPPMIYPSHVQVPVATPAGLILPIFSGDSIHGSILRAA